MSLRAGNGQYLCAEGGGGGDVVANRDTAGLWETFDKVDRPGNKVAFRTTSGHYLRAHGMDGGFAFRADSTQAGDQETFEILHQPYIFKDLEIGFTERFERVWQDHGSGADQNGGFWRPVPGDGYFSVGDMCVAGYDDPNGKKMVAVAKDLSGTALREPVDYRYVWNDMGSGADHNVSVWEPVAPAGYRAMGCVAVQGYDRPALNRVRCVREDLVARGSMVEEKAIWQDGGSGANDDFSAWSVSALPAGPGEARLAPGGFVGHNGYGKPDLPTTCHTFRLPLLELPPLRKPEEPALDLRPGERPPEYFPSVAHHVVYIPWYGVTDPALTDVDRVRLTPIYRLEREDRYHLEAVVDNRRSTTQQTETFKYTLGFKETDEFSFTHTTGVKLTWTYEMGAALGKDIVHTATKYSVEISTSFAWGKKNTTERSSTSEKSFTVVAPGGTLQAVYTIKSVARLFRQDGTPVGPAVQGTAPETLVYVEVKK